MNFYYLIVQKLFNYYKSLININLFTIKKIDPYISWVENKNYYYWVKKIVE